MNFSESFSERFPYKVKIDHSSADLFRWVIENVGILNYSFGEGHYYFKREEDAVMFKLRWS